MSGKKSRNKGARGEREFSEWLRLHGIPAHRGRQYHSSDDSPDVIHGLGGVHFEVKRAESISPYAALAQAEQDAADRIPIVAHKRNRKEWILICRAEDVVELLKEKFLNTW